MIEVRSINHVSVLVSDTARSVDFYRGVLGLQIDSARPPGLTFPGAWLRIGNQSLHLIEPLGEVPHVQQEHCGRDRHLALDVADLDAVIKALDVSGIDYTLSRSGRRALFCRDPDGNAIELIEAG
ncbi:MAG: VOC family protein [Gammaproteobacteria bacterium]